MKARRASIAVVAALLLLTGISACTQGGGVQNGEAAKAADVSLKTLNDDAANRNERADAVRRLVNEVYDAATNGGKEFADDAVMDAALSTRVAEALGRYMPSVHHALAARTGGEPISADASTALDFSSDRDLLTKLVIVYAELCKHEKSCAIVRAYNSVTTIANLSAATRGTHSPLQMAETMAGPARGSATIMAALQIGEGGTNNSAAGIQGSRDASVVGAKQFLGVHSSDRNLDAEALAHRLSTLLSGGTFEQRADALTTMWASSSQTEGTLRELVRDVAWRDLSSKAYPRGLGPADDLDSITDQQQIAIQDWEETTDTGNDFKSLRDRVASSWFTDGAKAAKDLFGDLLR